MYEKISFNKEISKIQYVPQHETLFTALTHSHLKLDLVPCWHVQ